jgi:hypothetical protein
LVHVLLAQPQYCTPSAVRRRTKTKLSGETVAHVRVYFRREPRAYSKQSN